MQVPNVGILLVVHDEMIQKTGGAAGVRDPEVLEAVCAGPLNAIENGKTEVFEATAKLAAGVAQKAPFNDGNKRAALLTIAITMAMNGYRFDPDPGEEVLAMKELADCGLTEDVLAEWIKDSVTPDPVFEKFSSIDLGLGAEERKITLRERIKESRSQDL